MIGSIASHYRILDHLGTGGMGEVFLAQDTRLRRPVALKMLSHCAEGDETHDRVIREARVASALNHPGIAVIYEIGEAELEGSRRSFIAMEYVPGQSLKQILMKGPLAASEALDIVSQLAEALAEAHSKGVIHRDVKPANVMISDRRRVKLLDFGLAKYSPPPDGGDDTWSGVVELQQPGAVIGTVAYMSPEQARGKPLDARSDVFSLGVVLYELLAGRPPFTGDNAVEILDAILREDPRPAPELEAGLGRELERVARKMMSKKRDERYANVTGVREDLESLRQGGAGPVLAEPSVPAAAVTRFANITGNAEDDWLGTGIAETVTADLRTISGLTVIARERVHEVLRSLTGEDEQADEAFAANLGRELGARWIVSGGYQRQGEALRVTARVVDPRTGTVAHTVKVDGTMAGLFELQDRIVAEISAGLRLGLFPSTREGEETHVVEAYEAYSKGVINLRAESLQSLDTATSFFERAIALDPGYVAAHLGLGSAHELKAGYLASAELGESAIAAFRRALALRPDHARAWRELGSALLGLGRDDEAMEAVERALELGPDQAAAHSTLGRILFIGRAEFEEAAAAFERALELNPKGGWHALQLAHCATLLRDFPRAEAAARRALVLQEGFLSGREGLVIVGSYVRLAHAAALQGRHADALEALEREADFVRRVDHALGERILIEILCRKGSSQLRLGDDQAARETLALAVERQDRRVRKGNDEPFTRYYAACARALLGETQAALDDLERAASARRAFTVRRALLEPDLETVVDHPRFRRLTSDESSGEPAPSARPT